MAQRLVNRRGSTNLPGSYPNLSILSGTSNTPVAGILCLVGEADAGPAWTLEQDLSQNFYTPDQFAQVRAKYRSGRLVDAAFGAITPSQDAKLTGSPAAIYLVKTNPSTKAQATLFKTDGTSTYHYLADKSYGDYGNLTAYDLSVAQAEVVPTTGPFTLLVPNLTTDLNIRVNGGTALMYQAAVAALPPTIVAALNALAGVACTGGADRILLTVAGTLGVAVAGNQVTITRSVAWVNQPVVGDSLYIVAGSIIQGAANKNRGSYVVTSSTTTTVVATKLLDDAGPAGSVTAPEAVAPVNVAALTDLNAFAPVTLFLEPAAVIDGAGKALEVNELTTSAGRLSDLAYQLNVTKVTWVSRTGTPVQLASAAEYQVRLSDSRVVDNLQETAATSSGVTTLGGEVVMSVGYLGTTATLTVGPTVLTTTVTGGAGTSLSLKYSRFQTLSDLAGYIAQQPGYSATLLLPQYGSKPPGLLKLGGAPGYLDQVTAIGICTTFGAQPGRLKVDARTFYDAVSATQLVQLGTAQSTLIPQPAVPVGNLPAPSGLPLAPQVGYLAGGLKAGTTAAALQAAIDATEGLNINFGCLLVAQDATSDISDGETESSSTYQLESAVAYARLQAERLSTQFERKPRQWFAGVMGSYVTTQRPLAIRQSTQGRLALCFQDVLALGPDAFIEQKQPWYAAVLAAAGQGAARNRGILHREPTQSGVIHRFGDFDAGNRGQVSSALDSGLLVLSQGAANPGVVGSKGRWSWTSDQTCYVRDNSFYANSIQAIFVADLLRMSVSQGAEDSIVGESQADVDAVIVKKVVEGLLKSALDLGYIVTDDRHPKGYLSVNVVGDGPTYRISIQECVLSTLIYFLDMDFSIASVQRSA